MEIELKGGRLKAAAAAGGRRRGLQPRARRRGGRCRLAPEGQRAGRGQCRHGVRGRSPGGAARHSRSPSPRRQAGPGHGAAAARRIDGVRRTHADLCRSGARWGGQRGRRETQRAARRRPGRLALGPRRRDGRRRGQRRPGDRHAAGAGRVHEPRRHSGLGACGGQGHRRAERGARLAGHGGGRRSRAQLPRTADRRGDRQHRGGRPRHQGGDGARSAALTGLAPPLRLEGLPVTGSLTFSTDRNTLALDRLALNIAGSDLKGQLSIAAAGDRRRVEARLDVDELSLARMLGLLQDQRLAVAAAAETAVSGRQGVWSDEPFDASVLDGFEGNVTLTAKRLVLAEGMSLSQASIDVALQGRQGGGEAVGGRPASADAAARR